MSDAPKAAPGGAPSKEPKPKTPDEVQKDIEHKLTHFDKYAKKFEKSRYSKTTRERGKTMSRTVEHLRGKLAEYVEAKDDMEKEVKHSTLRKIDTFLQTRIDYHNRQAYKRSSRYKRRKYINIKPRAKTKTIPGKQKSKPAAAAAAATPAAPAAKPQSTPESAEREKIAPTQSAIQGRIDEYNKIFNNPKTKRHPKYGQLTKEFKRIKKEFKAAKSKLKQGEEMSDAIRLKIGQDLDNLHRTASNKGTTHKNPLIKFKPKAKPKTNPSDSEPIKGSEKKELKDIPDSKRNLVKDLRDLESGNVKDLREMKRRISNNLRGLGIRPGSELNKVKTQTIADGYEVGMINWPKPKDPNQSRDSFPNIVIYKNGKLICFQTGTAETGTSLRTPAEATPRNLKVANVIKGHAVVSDLRKNLVEVAGGKEKFKSIAKMNEFKVALKDFAKSLNRRTLDNARGKYALVINSGGTDVYFKNRGNGQGEYKIKVGASIYFFDTQTGKIGTAQDVKGKITDKGYSNEIKVLTKGEKKGMDKAKEDKARVAKYKEGRKQMKAHMHDTPDGYVKFNDKDPYEFTITANKKNPEHKKLLRKSIGSVLDLKKVKDKVLYITVTDAKGKNPRQAMYFPGDKHPYLIVKGTVRRQKRYRLKYYNGDKIKVQFKKPTDSFVASKLSTKDKIKMKEKIREARAKKAKQKKQRPKG
jgi:hypothetical protein